MSVDEGQINPGGQARCMKSRRDEIIIGALSPPGGQGGQPGPSVDPQRDPAQV